MKLSSIQRRMERYRIMYIWKVVSGKVPNFGLKWTENSIRGKMVTIKTYNSSTPAMARKMIDQSQAVHGGSLFDLLPEKLRSFMGTVEEFKSQLLFLLFLRAGTCESVFTSTLLLWRSSYLALTPVSAGGFSLAQ